MCSGGESDDCSFGRDFHDLWHSFHLQRTYEKSFLERKQSNGAIRTSADHQIFIEMDIQTSDLSRVTKEVVFETNKRQTRTKCQVPHFDLTIQRSSDQFRFRFVDRHTSDGVGMLGHKIA